MQVLVNVKKKEREKERRTQGIHALSELEQLSCFAELFCQLIPHHLTQKAHQSLHTCI